MSLSNPAKLLAGYMKATGISDAKVIADTLGIPLRTIQRLKLDVACANDANDATRGVSESANCAMDGVSEAPMTPPMASLARVEDNNINTTPKEYKQTPPITNITAPQPEPKTKRGSRLADDWSLPEDWRNWTRVNFPLSTAEQVDRLADEFRDYWIAVPGQRGCKADWQATWRNRCRDRLSTAPTRPQRIQPPSDRPLNDREARMEKFKAALSRKREETAHV